VFDHVQERRGPRAHTFAANINTAVRHATTIRAEQPQPIAQARAHLAAVTNTTDAIDQARTTLTHIQSHRPAA
jgi:hypothetical protein